MRGVNIMVATADAARFYAAMEAAMALAALGRGVRVFLQADAVAVLRPPIRHAGDAARRAVGQPDLAAMLGEVLMSDTTLSLCQTGLEIAGLTAADVDSRISATGLVGWLAQASPDDALCVF